ncbi:DNRLRE domain-containing protein [Brevibacillus formosus]|nr:DNRLRE domain-containing protein [Brevibacillus formosus]
MPVVTLDYQNSLRKSTFVYYGSPDSSFNTSTSIDIGTSGGGASRSLLMFDLGSIPNGAIINSAKVALTRYSGNVSGSVDMLATAIFSDWEETVTWNTQPTLSGTYDVSTINGTATTVEINVKSLVQKWVNGELSNKGMLLNYNGEPPSLGVFTAHSSRSGTVSSRPTLTIDYTLPTDRKDVYFVNNTENSSSGTQINVQIPSGYKVGDVALIALHNNATTVDVPIPSGWTELKNVIANDLRYIFVYKVLTDSEQQVKFESSTYVNAAWHATVVVYRNVKSVGLSSYNNFPSAVRDIYFPDRQAYANGSFYVGVNMLTTNDPIITRPKGFTNRMTYFTTYYTHHWQDKNLHAEKSIPNVDDRTTSYRDLTRGIAVSVILTPFINEPPTPPKNVRVDKTSYEVGDIISINFDPGTDTEGGAVKYRIHQYIPDTKTWQYAYTAEKTNPVLTCTSMIDTNASKVGVISEDDKGALSSMSESATFIVKQKPGQIIAPVEAASSYYHANNRVPVMRFENGWLGSVARSSGGTYASVFISKDNGKTWNNYGSIDGAITKGISATSNKNMLYVVYARSATEISAIAVDVSTLPTTPTNETIPADATTVINGTDHQSVDVTFDKTNNMLLVVSASKTAAYPTSFNIHRTDLNLYSSGVIAGVTYIKAVTTVGNGVIHQTNVGIDVSNDGTHEYITSAQQSGTNNFFDVHVRETSTSTWTNKVHRLTTTGTVINPNVVVSPDNTVNISFVGLTNGANKAIFIRSTTRGADWGTEKDLGNAEDVAMSVAPNNDVHMLVRNSATLFQVISSDGFVTFQPSKILTQNVQTSYVNALSTFKEKSFKTKFTIPPTIFRSFRSSDSAQSLSYVGAIDVGKPPVITLSSPADDIELIEGASYTIAGVARSEVDGAVVVVNTNFASGNIPIGTFISDGVTPFNFSKTFTYKNKQMFDGNTPVSPILAENKKHVANTHAVDTTNNLTSSLVAKFFTVKYNRAPVISGTNQDLGAFMQIPIVNYSATDPEGNTFTFSEYLNGKQIRSFAGVAGQQYTVEISHDAWIRLDLDVQHQIKIVATDSAGISSERIYTFTRKETHIEFMLEYGNPDIKADFTLDGMPLRVLVTLERYLPEGSSIESVKVCNNYLDDVPTWEDCTNAVKVNRGYLFTNKNKTAPEWAINLWVTIDKGTAKERVLVNGYGGAFD